MHGSEPCSLQVLATVNSAELRSEPEEEKRPHKELRRGRREMLSNPFDQLPTTVEIDGYTYPIQYDFRFGVSLESGGEPDVAVLLSAFYPQGVPVNVEAAAEKMLEFYQGYADQDKLIPVGQGKVRQYDYAADADVLIASFLDCYGVDLTTDRLHWWTFRRLMLSLPDDSPFMERVRYRVIDISKLDKKLQSHYRKMRSIYALKSRPGNGSQMTVEQRDAALQEKIRRRYEEAQRARNTT